MGQKLGDAVKEIIQEKNITVLQLAKEVDVDRTTLQHFFSGKRKVQFETFQEMMNVLNLTKEKRKLLYRLYEKECQDKELVKNVQDIFSLYDELTDHIDLNKMKMRTDAYCIKNCFLDEKMQLIKGSVKIEELIRSCFIEEMGRKEKGHVIMSINFRHLFIYELIMRTTNGRNLCGKIQSIFPFVNKKTLGNNIDELKKVLQLKCLENVDHEPYYFYTGTKIYDDISIIVPNYFITSKYVIAIERDFESALISDKPEIIQYYREKAESIIDRCDQLVEKKNVRCLTQTIPAFEKVGGDHGSGKFYTLEQMRYLRLGAIESQKKARTTKMVPLPVKDKEEHAKIYVLRDSFINASESVSIRYLADEEQVEFIVVDKDKESAVALCVTEIGLVSVFKEFFDYLPRSCYVYSPEELDRKRKNIQAVSN
jgi:transcriptional regulator with XRE-family HTH domain